MKSATLLTASKLSRELGCSIVTVTRAVHSKRITPDFLAGEIQLFRPERLRAIGAAMKSKIKTP